MKIKPLLFITILLCFTNSFASNEEMRFSIFQPCDGNGSHCASYILADGLITQDTPHKFSTFLKNNNLPRPIVYLNSKGGNLDAGLKLGKIIRQNKLDTFIGAAEDVDFNFPALVNDELNPKRYITVLNSSHCYSACAYAFLGGVVRDIEWETSKYGVHQFYSPDSQGKEDTTQVIYSLLSLYLDEMKINRKLLNIASFTSKNRMHLLSKLSSKELNITNKKAHQAPWKLDATAEGDLVLCSVSKPEGTDASTTLCYSKNSPKESFTAHIFFSPSIKDSDDFKQISDDLGYENESCPYFDIGRSNSTRTTSLIVKPDNCTDWQSSGSYFHKALIIKKTALFNTINSSEFEVNFEFSGINSHLDPSAIFSNAKIHGMVKALLNTN